MSSLRSFAAKISPALSVESVLSRHSGASAEKSVVQFLLAAAPLLCVLRFLPFNSSFFIYHLAFSLSQNAFLTASNG